MKLGVRYLICGQKAGVWRRHKDVGRVREADRPGDTVLPAFLVLHFVAWMEI
jgi:hypothetical protein